MEETTKTISVGSFALLCFAVVHEWGYFTIIGREYQGLMGPTDYLNSAIFWLPYVGLVFLAQFVLEAFLKRKEGFQTEAQIVASSPNPKKTKFYRDLPWKLVYIQMVIIGIVLLFFVSPLLNIFLAVTISGAWTGFCTWVLSHPSAQEYVTKRIAIIIMIAPLVLLMSLSLGHSDGYAALKTVGKVYVLKFEDSPEKNVIILRSLAQGILVREPLQSRVAYYKWDDITELSSRPSGEDYKPFACQYFLIGCGEIPSP